MSATIAASGSMVTGCIFKKWFLSLALVVNYAGKKGDSYEPPLYFVYFTTIFTFLLPAL